MTRTRMLADRRHVLAGAAATAAVLAGKVDAERPVVVVSGGNVSPQTASGILALR